MKTHVEEKALRAPRTLSVSSSAFQQGRAIPREHSGWGDDVSPELHVAGVPTEARALAIVVDDPDAPRGTYTHWTVWNLPPTTLTLARDADVRGLGARVGRNDFGATRYGGPMPPSGTHRYFFRVFALDAPLDLPEGAAVADVWRELGQRTIAWGELMGTFTRP